MIFFWTETGRENILCDIIIDRNQDSRQLLHQMRTIPRQLQLLNDPDDDIIIDALGIDFRRDPVSHGRRRWRVLPGGAPDRGAMFFQGRWWLRR